MYQILALSLFLVLGSGGFSIFSPGLYASMFALLYISSSQIYYVALSGFAVLKEKLYSSILVILLTVITLMKTSENELLIELGRLFYIIGCLLIAERIKHQSSSLINRFIPFIFFIDFIYRIITMLFLGKSFLDMYSWKSSLIFPDTNFIALILLFYLLPFITYHIGRGYFAIILLLSCISRGAFIGFMLSYLSNRIIFIALILSVLIYYYLGFHRDDILGSLGTKIVIFKMSLFILFTDIDYAFWGVGKLAVTTLSNELGQRFGGTTVGHTIFGVIVEQGLVWVFLALTLTLRCVVVTERWRFGLMLGVVGFLALFPITYLGLLVIVYNNSFNFLRSKHSKMLEQKCD